MSDVPTPGPTATACPPSAGGDVDGDGVCGDDDNCPDDFNPDQSNLDGDALGDVCDDLDGFLNIRRTRIRQTASPGRGRIILRGDILLTLPDDEFDASGGVAVAVFDDLGLARLFEWDPSECTTHARSGRVTCRSGDKNLQGKFKPLKRHPERLSFSITFKKLDLEAPFGAPVMVVITDNPGVPMAGVDRMGIVTDCKSSKNSLSCKGS